MHRKSIIRLIRGELARKPRCKQRGKTYGVEIENVVEKIARSLDYSCAEHTAHRKGQPKGSYAQRQGIPIRCIPWDENMPGYLEIDLVHHSGSSPSGQYVHTLQATDVATGWSGCVAILERSYLVIQDGFQRLEQRLPFTILKVHPDNGSEFLNDPLVHFWRERARLLELSGSHPYAKNDNCFVEENNFSLVHAYLGYDRLDTVAHTHLLNQLYGQLWLYHNFFQSVMRLQAKHFTDGRCKRIYDTAVPSLERLLRANLLSPHKLAHLLALRQSTNPLHLCQQIHARIDQIAALPLANGTTEDVRFTLFSLEAAIAG